MRKFWTLPLLLLALCATRALGQQAVSDLDARGTLTATDVFECADPTVKSYKCTLLELATFALTYVNSEAELEALLADVTDVIVDGETVAETESIQWGDTMPVSPNEGDVFILTDADSADDCDPAGSGGLIATCYYNGSSWGGLHAWLEDDTYGDIQVTGGGMQIGSGTVTTTEIADDTIDEVDLDISNSPTDTYVLSWATGDILTWVSNSAGAESDTTLTDDDAVSLGDNEDDAGADFVLTFDADTGTDGTLTWDVSADEFAFSAPISVPASATPTSSWTDSNETADPKPTSTQIVTNCTDPAEGQEDCDMTFSQLVNTSMTAFLTSDADGSGSARIVFPDDVIGPDEVLAAGQTDEYNLTYESTSDTWAYAPSFTIQADDTNTAAITGDETLDIRGGVGLSTTLITGDPEQFAVLIDYTITKASDPTLGSGKCIASQEGTNGGGWLCEGETADAYEMLLEVPLADPGADTDITLVGADTTQTLENKTIDSSNTVAAGALDAEVLKGVKCYYHESPAVEDLDGYWQAPQAVTVARVWCETDSGTATLNIERDDGSAADVLSADIVCDAGEQTSCASGCDVDTIAAAEDNIAQYEEINLSISATASSPNKVSVCVHYTIDDA
jgi:hypothetical protein